MHFCTILNNSFNLGFKGLLKIFPITDRQKKGNKRCFYYLINNIGPHNMAHKQQHKENVHDGAEFSLSSVHFGTFLTTAD